MTRARINRRGKPLIGTLGGTTLVLGLLFGPLRRLLEVQIERRFFPERRALRRRLADLARELPRQGTLPAISDELVCELREIFALKGVVLCLAEGEAALLSHRASSPTRAFGVGCRALSLADGDVWSCTGPWTTWTCSTAT